MASDSVFAGVALALRENTVRWARGDRRVLFPLLLLLGLPGCSSLDDQIVRLGAGGQESERAKQELLLAKGNAVPALLAALENPDFTTGRPEIAEVLVGLMTRVDDNRINTALRTHLIEDPDPDTRIRIIREVGMLKRLDFADALIAAIEDSHAQVRGEALTVLGFIRKQLSPDQLSDLAEKVRHLSDDENRDVRLGARIIVGDRVDVWLKEAMKEALVGQLAVAESLYHEALAYAPNNKKVNFRLGRYLFSNGERDRGLQVLRDSGWLLDIPRLESVPAIDGHLDDPVWRQAALSATFHAFSENHNATVESKVRTVMYAGYTREALFLGIHCEDPDPDSLIVVGAERDHDRAWLGDLVEWFFDTNLDEKTYLKTSINSEGTIIDGRGKIEMRKNADLATDFESEAAAHIGDSFWSVEYRLDFGQPDLPKPTPGTIWGVDVQRGLRRGEEWSHWTRSFPDAAALETYGWFLFW